MVKFYEERVINGLKKWTDVPELWNAKVIERLQKDGYVLNEDGTVTKKVKENHITENSKSDITEDTQNK
ncbi:hypothetical protein DW842_07275 [Ruminococcus sp. AM36-17]|nr:hypothetical protein DW842_07275 [Ruminococcus sp. AM36-17]